MEYAAVRASNEPAPTHPCGANLEYDMAFIELQQAAISKREQQFGDAVIAAVPPDWRQVERQATRLLERTTDLRVIALLTLAWTEIDGLAGYANGLALAADALERHWDEVHPQVESAGESDPMARVNALASLTDAQTLGASLRNATLLHVQTGAITLGDAATSLANGTTRTILPAPLEDAAALRSALKAAHAELGIVHTLLGMIKRTESRVATMLDASWVPDSSAVTGMLRIVAEAMREPEAAASGRAEHIEPNGQRFGQRIGERSEPAFVPVAAAQTGTLGSRADAVRALDHVCAYLEAAEPAHPAPLLIRRAQRLLQMNFHDIVRDMVPEALPQIEALAGRTS